MGLIVGMCKVNFDYFVMFADGMEEIYGLFEGMV